MRNTPFLDIIVLLSFLANTFGQVPLVYAQELRLPTPGVMVTLSPEFNPSILKGLKVHPDNPFQFDFILDQGDGYGRQPGQSEGSQQEQVKTEATKLIKYFLASLTVPEKDLWVNLSPYEKDRIIPQSFGQTEMGRDLLSEDYMLKQITASLIYPEGATGKKFWQRIYAEAEKKFGTTNIPVNTFNKVWIIPDKAVVYENPKAGTAYVVESKLKVMLEQDYLSLAKHAKSSTQNNVSALGSNIVREIVIPELTREVNLDRNFAQLRQVYNSLILATWYKKKIKDSILSLVYADKNKTTGIQITSSNKNNIESIYQRYLQAFKKGAYNYIKDDVDPVTQAEMPRKYFSGGFSGRVSPVMELANKAQLSDQKPSGLIDVVMHLDAAQSSRPPGVKVSQETLLSEDLPLAEFDKQWKQYVAGHGLSGYKNLLRLFKNNRKIKEALLDDPTLRPVFLQVLPPKSMGPLKKVRFADQRIGPESLIDLMQHYSSFLVGDAQLADRMLNDPSKQIVIGLTDRYSEDTFLYQVANARQDSYPLADGRWLNVKGSGQFADPLKPPVYTMVKLTGRVALQGIAYEHEAERAWSANSAFPENNGEFVNFLGYRFITRVPDGKGGLKNIKEYSESLIEPSQAVLIFNLSLSSPQRLVKLLQIVKSDPGLRRISQKISRILVKSGALSAGASFSGKDLIMHIFRTRGRAEAWKQNKQLYKISIHPQDITIAGEESDNEEFVSYKAYRKLIEKGFAMKTEDMELLDKYNLSMAGMRVMFNTLTAIMRTLPEDQLKILLPNPLEALEILFRSYFSSLDSSYLDLWATSYKGQSLPVRSWGKIIAEFNKQNRNSDDNIGRLILRWAKEIKKERDSAQLAGDLAMLAADFSKGIEGNKEQIAEMEHDLVHGGVTSENFRYTGYLVSSNYRPLMEGGPEGIPEEYLMRVYEHRNGLKIIQKRVEEGVGYRRDGEWEAVKKLAKAKRASTVPLFIVDKEPGIFYELDLRDFKYQELTSLGADWLTDERRRKIIAAVNEGLRFDRDYWFEHGHLHGWNILIKTDDKQDINDVRIIDFTNLSEDKIADNPVLSAIRDKNKKPAKVKNWMAKDISLDWMDLAGYDFEGLIYQIHSCMGSILNGTNFSGAQVMEKTNAFQFSDMRGLIMRDGEMYSIYFDEGLDMEGADLDGTYIGGAEVRATIGLVRNMDKVKNFRHARFSFEVTPEMTNEDILRKLGGSDSAQLAEVRAKKVNAAMKNLDDEGEFTILSNYGISLYHLVLTRKNTGFSDVGEPAYREKASEFQFALREARRAQDAQAVRVLSKWKRKEYAALWGNLVKDPVTGKVGIVVGGVESGKSTLSYYLSRSNFQALSDDGVALFLRRNGELDALGELSNGVIDRGKMVIPLTGSKKYMPVSFIIYLRQSQDAKEASVKEFVKEAGVLVVNPKYRAGYLKAISRLPELVLDHSKAGIKNARKRSIEKEVRLIKEWLERNWAMSSTDSKATSKTGGIDLTPASMNLQTKLDHKLHWNDGIKFHIDAAMLAQYQNTRGFVPVITSVRSLGDLKTFLGANT